MIVKRLRVKRYDRNHDATHDGDVVLMMLIVSVTTIITIVLQVSLPLSVALPR